MSNEKHPHVPSIINAKKKLLRKKGQVKEEIDDELHFIYESIRKNNNLHNQKIPTLDKNLVQRYIRKIYSDYGITDPLEEKEKHVTPKNINKTALKLKQTFITQLKKNQRTETTIPNKGTSSHRQQKIGNENNRVKDSYRFCFICESPVLQANINYHQQNECPQLVSFYESSAQELENYLQKKVLKLWNEVEEIKERINKSREIENMNNRITKATDYYLETVQQNIREKKDTMQERYRLKKQFRTIMQCYNNDYSKLYETIPKLQWFLIMYKNFYSFIGEHNGNERATAQY